MDHPASFPPAGPVADPDPALLRALWDVAADAIVAADLDGLITAWNPAAERLFGYAAREVLGVHLSLAAPREERPVLEELLARLFAGEDIPPYRACRQRKDGSRIAVSISARRVERAGRPIGLVAILRDVTEQTRAEEETARSEARFRALVEHASDLITILDRDGVMVYKSPACQRTLGFAPAELVGRNAFDLLHPDDIPAARRSVRACVRHARTPVPYAARFRHRDGHWVDLEGTCTSLLDDPSVGGIVVNSRDVSARLRDQAELRASESRYRELFEDNRAVQMLLDPETGAILDGNAAAAEMYGYSREHLRTLRMWEISELGEQEVRARLGRAAGGSGGVIHAPHRVASGAIRTVEVRTSPTRLEGRTVVHAIIHDVTDRVEAEMAVRASEGRLRLLLGRLPAVIWTTDRDLRLTSAEGSAIEGLGLSREQLEGQLLTELLADEATAAVGIPAHQQALAGRPATYEGRFGDAVFTCHVEALRVAGAVAGVVGVAFEITAQKELEEQLHQARKMEAIGRLAGGVAHDFNNLLTAIRGNVEFLLEDLPESVPSRADVLEISHAAARAADLTQQLLAFGRKQVLQPRRIDLNQTVRETERMLRRVIGEDVDLVTRLAPGVGAVEADPGQMTQVLMNLAVNARDAMPAGGTLTIATRGVALDERLTAVFPQLSPGSGVVELRVCDTGTGIPREVQAHVFEPFFTTKGVGKGTGLGLATVYGIIKQSGGYLKLDSEPGQGTAFSIYLPELEGPPAAG